MEIIYWNRINKQERKQILSRPVISNHYALKETVAQIIKSVKEKGDKALYELTQKHDGVTLKNLLVSEDEIEEAFQNLKPEVIEAIKVAFTRIKNYHRNFLPKIKRINTHDGIICERIPKPISAVGLYVPGGTAPLISTLMMLAIPAKIAGCKLKVLCTPPDKEGGVNPYLLFTAHLCGINKIYKIGGAQAVAAMAYGTPSIPKVNKIYGPGNAWVTEAKLSVSQDPEGASIDLPAGPSEVMIIADRTANPSFIASDLLSQAEHGPDSQVMLITDCLSLANKVNKKIIPLLVNLKRKSIIAKSLSYSRIILVNKLEDAFDICNTYAPEHLILQLNEPRNYLSKIQTAGAIFLGALTPETLGDYVTGSNHVLPTYGFAKSYSGLAVDDYMTFISVQESNLAGLQNLGQHAIILAELEGLDAHKSAISIRLKSEGTMRE